MARSCCRTAAQWELVSPPSKQGASIEADERRRDRDIRRRQRDHATSRTGRSKETLPAIRVRSGRRRCSPGAAPAAGPQKISPHRTTLREPAAFPNIDSSLPISRGRSSNRSEICRCRLKRRKKRTYVRDDENGSYVPLLTAGDVSPPGAKFGVGEGAVALAGTPDLSHVILSSREVRLTRDAIELESLYEWSGGQLQLVNVESDGTVTPRGYLGGPGRNFRHALSSDGSRVFWSPSDDDVYMRDTVTGKTLKVDAPAPGVTQLSGNLGEFQAASADGSKVFFLDNAPLTLDSTLPPGGGQYKDLYVCQIVEEAGEPRCDLTDLSVDPGAGEQANVQDDVVGASEDGSIVYFVATGKLAEGAQVGGDNLYVESESGSTWSAPRLVAVLSEEDRNDWEWRSLTLS